MTRELVIGIAIITCITASHYFLHYFGRRRSLALVKRWASANSYTIINAERRRELAQGPFLDPNPDQDVYFVTVQDAQGRTGCAFVRVGKKFLGLVSNRVEVKWE